MKTKEVLDLLKKENPESYYQCKIVSMAGCTGSEIRVLLRAELKKIPSDSVSSMTYSKVQELIADLAL
jgi:hypothetical protein